MALLFIEKFGEIEITLSPSGWFHASLNGRDIRDRTLPGIKKKLTVTGNPLDVLVRDWFRSFETLEHHQVIKEADGRYRNVKTGRLLTKFVSIYEYDAEAERQSKDLEVKHRVFVNKYDEIVARLKQIQ